MYTNMKFLRQIALVALLAGGVATSVDACAIQYNMDRLAFKLSGYGMVGLVEPEFKTPLWFGDWRVRAQAGYALATGRTIGMVYAIDAIAIDENDFKHEMFMFAEDRNYGRMEVGFTDSVAHKLGLGLPDVGGWRINEQPLFYKKIHPDGAIVSDTLISSGHDALRVNLVSVPTNLVQYGVSVAGLSDEYDYVADAALKFRKSDGKLKAALSLGASFMDDPDNYHSDIYTHGITADWRAQAYAGANIQYNSWVFGASVRVIYDENPIGPVADGMSAGIGASYDILNYSLSLNYIISDTDVWHHDVRGYVDNTIIGSFRYKYSENVDGWTSLGITTKTPFVAAGIRLTF